MIIALGIEYRGSAYCGWQRQRHSPSVQQLIEVALSKVADSSINVQCSGRTDSGVHALQQVVSFKSPVERPAKAWVLGGNAHLPDDITIRWAHPVPDDFNARFSALARSYQYLILNRPTRSALFDKQVTWVRDSLDEDLMHSAAQALLGEQDFSCFQAASCQSPTPFRNVHSCSVMRRGDFVRVSIKANAFLHHMVRNIVGSLIEVGRGNQKTSWIGELLTSRDRKLAAPTAPPYGLYFVTAHYPNVYSLPKNETYADFFD